VPLPDRDAWSYQQDGLLAVGVHTQLPRYGEDAEPLLAHHVPTGQGMIGVFDGSGGSGAAVAHTSALGTKRSGAWVGARVARSTVEKWFRDTVAEQVPLDVESLHQRLVAALCARRSPTKSKIVGTMRRELPTTMAAVHYACTGKVAECRVLWAGDSRAYTLSHQDGLHALSRDHTVETDALEQLRQDPPMTNVICADRPFEIESRTLKLILPTLLVVATDGFFGYVDTPAQFECHLLGTLRQASDGQNWAERLVTLVKSYSADDASLAIVALGYRDFRSMQADFLRRAEEVITSYGRLPDAADKDNDIRRQWQVRTWDSYRQGYEIWLRACTEGTV
jgi:serine/threonine protein phosphatase PrpC